MRIPEKTSGILLIESKLSRTVRVDRKQQTGETTMLVDIKITRDEYNSLVEKFPDWMGNVWPKFRKEWSLTFVRICKAPNRIDFNWLRKHLDLIKK